MSSSVRVSHIHKNPKQFILLFTLYFECLRMWHHIVLQPITQVYMYKFAVVTSTYWVSQRSVFKKSQGIVKPRSNGILKWQHTGTKCAVWTPFVVLIVSSVQFLLSVTKCCYCCWKFCIIKMYLQQRQPTSLSHQLQ
mgnify:CR=1 FL=1